MNRKIWASLACASLLVAFSTGCKEETALVGDNTGYISLALDFDPSPLQGPRADRSRADEPTGENTDDPTAPVLESDLSLTLSRDDGALPPEELTIDDLSEPKTVYTGDYTLEAAYGSDTDEGWDNPYYYGSQQLTVEHNSETHVSLPVRLANSIINIIFSDKFLSFLNDFKVTVTSSAGNDFKWVEDNSSSLYVTPGEVLLTVDFTKPNGSTATFQVDPFEAEAQHNYTVTLDVDYQTETLSVTTDDTLDDPKEVEISITDENLPKLAPKPIILPVEGFTFGSEIDVVSGNMPEEKPVATIIARGGIEKAELFFTSAYLTSRGLNSPIDLTQENDILSELGLTTRGLTTNREVFATVDFSGFISSIPFLEDAEQGDNTSTFSLKVTDSRNVESNLTNLFTLNVEKITLEILDGSIITEQGKAKVIVRYNGPDPENEIRIEGHNDAGGIYNVPITKCEPGSSKGVYNLTIESADISLNETYYIHAKTIYDNYDHKEDFSHYMLEIPPIHLKADATNAFAKYAYVSVSFTTEDDTQYKNDVRFEVSSDTKHKTYTSVTSEYVSDNFSTNPTDYVAVYKLTGLTPATNYVFRAIIDGREITESAPLNTESAAQIPNGNLDAAVIKDGNGNNWENLVFTGWGTNNPMTTSQGADVGYCRVSGTIQTDGDYAVDGKGKSVEIRTVGWGSGNTASGSVTTGKCKYLDPGLLHLGTSRKTRPSGYEDISGSFDTDDLECGIPFSSRPTSMSFSYKSELKNSADKGEALIWIKDNEGNIIATNRIELTAKSSFEGKTTLPLSYNINAAKGAKIYIRFLSTIVPDALTKNKNWLNAPDFGNLSDGTYMGSKFWIDNIELNY